ncbi:MAG: EAL domain-containing protein [Erysipelotrichaceae bacterium]|nr:EAL domain-containing protein [Erysipelotrichaceae bacterium]
MASGNRDEVFLKLEEALVKDYGVFFTESVSLKERLGQKKWDVLILDLRRKEDKQLIKEIRDLLYRLRLPVLIVSQDVHIEERYHYLGADGLLQVPLPSFEIVLAKVKRAMLLKDALFVGKQRLKYEKDSGEKRFAERLLMDFERGIEEEEFRVVYQPKFNIKGLHPVLTSAEALVRWDHPRLGRIAPSLFIPLLEEADKISLLDAYVWRRAAHQIAEWKQRLKIAVPVSVNVSRKDLLKKGMTDRLKEVVEESGISCDELLLEITESAYMEDPVKIIEMTKELRDLGFLIEMDDFGTGYSSLSMVNRLSIDALKIDMCFIKDAFREKKKDTGMIAIILQIAKYLGVLSIAEGVEDLEQMEQLKALGCDIVQGYCFSRPVSAKDFESFLLRKMMLLEASERKRDRKRQKVTEKIMKDMF